MKILPLIIAILLLSTAGAASDRTWFTYGYGRGGGVKVEFQSEILDRLNHESMSIAKALIEADIMEGTQISVVPSPKSSHGFETKFECDSGKKSLIEGNRAAKVHEAIWRRYEQWIAARLSPAQIKDPTVLPVSDYVSEIRRKG